MYLLKVKHKLVDLVLLVKTKQWLLYWTGPGDHGESPRSQIPPYKGGNWSPTVGPRMEAQVNFSVTLTLGDIRRKRRGRGWGRGMARPGAGARGQMF